MCLDTVAFISQFIKADCEVRTELKYMLYMCTCSCTVVIVEVKKCAH